MCLRNALLLWLTALQGKIAGKNDKWLSNYEMTCQNLIFTFQILSSDCQTACQSQMENL